MDPIIIVLICAITVTIVFVYKVASIYAKNKLIYASTFARSESKVTIKHNKRKKKK